MCTWRNSAESKYCLTSARPEAGARLGANVPFLTHTLEAVRTDVPLLQDISEIPFED